MVDKQMLFSMIDELPVDDLEQLYLHIKQRRQVVSFRTATGTYQAARESTHQESGETIRAEVNAIIDDAVSLVRRKRETQEQAKQKS